MYQLAEDASKHTDKSGRLSQEYFLYHSSCSRTGTFLNAREITKRLRLAPGEYVVVPSTFSPGDEGDFLLRTFTGTSQRNAETMAPRAGMRITERFVDVSMSENNIFDAKFKKLFAKAAGRNGDEIDVFQLHSMFSRDVTQKESGNMLFSLDTTRSLFSMADVDRTGTLDYGEFRALQQRITEWQGTFTACAKNSKGDMVAGELREALSRLGFQLSEGNISAVVRRWRSREGGFSWQDFVHVCARLTSVTLYQASGNATRESGDDIVTQLLSV